MSSTENDTLSVIQGTEIPELLKMLEFDLPASIHALEYLRVALEWKEKRPEYGVLVLAPEGNYSGPTFLLHTIVKGRFCGTAYAGCDEGASRLERALKGTQRLDWLGGFCLSCLEPRSAGVVAPLASSRAPSSLVVHRNLPFYMTHHQLPPYPEPELEEAVTLGPLEERHMERVLEEWPHARPHLEDLVRDSVILNGGLGVFRRSDGGLLSWGLIPWYGGVGLLFTLPEYRGRGYATAVLWALAASLASRGRNLHLNVLEGNALGERFFTRCGLTPLPRYTWVYNDFF